MRRALPLALVVLAAAVAVYFFAVRGGGAGDGSVVFASPPVLRVEEHLRLADLDGARAELESERDSLDPAQVAYLEGILALSDGRITVAERIEAARGHLESARRGAPSAWRPLDAYVRTLRALGQEVEAGRVACEAADGEAADDERALALAANLLLSSGRQMDPRRAAAYLDRIEELPARRAPEGDPTALEPRTLLVLRFQADRLLGRRRAALAVAQGLVAGWPNDPYVRILAGEAARELELYDDAADQYAVAVGLDPTNQVAQIHLVQILLHVRGREADLLRRSEALLAGAAPRYARTARVLRARALIRCDELRPGAYDEAEAIYRELLAADPDDTEVLRNLAILLYDWKQGGQEGEYLLESHRLLLRYRRNGGVIDGRLRDTWETLVRLARERTTPDDLEPLEQAWTAAPGDWSAISAYYDALAAAGRGRDGGTVVRRALEAAGDDLRVRLLAASHFLDEPADRDPAATLQQLDAADGLAQGAAAERRTFLRYRALAALGRWEDAFPLGADLARNRPANAAYQAAFGEAAAQLGRLGEAESAYREAAHLRPDDVSLRARLLGVRIDMGGREEEVLADTAALLGDHPLDRGLRAVRARALARDVTTRAAAFAIFGRLIEEDPKDASVLKMAALAHHAAGDLPEARRLLKEFDRAGPVSDPAMEELRAALRGAQ